jgi:hypothetical protein
MGNAFTTSPAAAPPGGTPPLEKFSVIVPPIADPVSLMDVLNALRVDSPSDTEQALIQTYIDAATDFAQDSLATSLMPQTLTAIFNAEDVELSPPVRDYPWDPLSPLGTPLGTPSFATWGTYNRAPVVVLPRGPVSAVTSVLDGAGNAVTGYVLERTAIGDRLRLTGSDSYPLTVTYTAGYANQAAIPASIRVAIMAHVGTLNANRASANAGGAKVVPHSLEAFYKIKARRIPCG